MYFVFNELNVLGFIFKWVFGNIGEFKDKVKKNLVIFLVLIFFNVFIFISDFFKIYVELCI